MGPAKKKAKTKSKCPDCIDWEQTPLWGHTLCSYHRDCSGKDGWEPDNCTDCKRQKATLAEISNNDQTKFFQEMYEMLDITKQHIQQVIKVDWEYDEILSIFLDKYEQPQITTENTTPIVAPPNNDDKTTSKDGKSENVDGENETRTFFNEYYDPYNEEENVNHDQYHYDNQFYDQDNNEYSDQVFNTNPNTENSTNTTGHIQDNNIINEPHNSMYLNSFNPTQFPMNFQNPINQNTFTNFDNYGRPVVYNIANNDNFNSGHQPYPVPMAPMPIYPFPPAQFQPQIFGGQPRKTHEVDPTTGETWLYLDPSIHIKKVNNKIEMLTPDGPKVINVRYKIGNPNMFKTLTTTADKNLSPFIDGREGHSVLLTSFDRSVSSNDLGNTKRIPFETRLDTASGLGTTLDLIKRFDTQMAEAVFENKLKDLQKYFPETAFDPVTVADFTSGWNLSSSSFAAFAKDKELVVKSLNLQLNMNINFHVPKHLLAHEKEARSRLVNTLTSLHLLDLLGEKIDSIDEHTKRTTRISSSQTKAIGRTMLPNFRSTVITWKIAKMKVRKQVFKNHTNSNILRLLRSSLWDENLFPKSVTDDLVKHGGRNMAPLLGLGGAPFANINNLNYNFPRKNPQINTINQFNRYRNRNQTGNQTFRDQYKGGIQKQQQNNHNAPKTVPQDFRRTSNTAQQTQIQTRGSYNSPGNRNQKQSIRGRGPYTRPTSANKTNAQNK